MKQYEIIKYSEEIEPAPLSPLNRMRHIELLMLAGMEEDSWVLDSLVGFLRGPVWNVPVLTFIEHKSLSKQSLLSTFILSRRNFRTKIKTSLKDNLIISFQRSWFSLCYTKNSCLICIRRAEQESNPGVKLNCYNFLQFNLQFSNYHNFI